MGFETCFFIDGQKIKFEKNKYGNYGCEVLTEKDEIEIRIHEWNEGKSKMYFIMSLIYFIVSIFSIFNTKQDKNFRAIDCCFKVKLSNKENNLNLSYNQFQEGAIAVVHESDCEVEVLSNRYYVDEGARTRDRVLKYIKLFVWVSGITGVIMLLT